MSERSEMSGAEVPVAVRARQRDLVAALARAGIDEVDVSRRRRAEYSSDASLYRLLPEAVAFPRDADEVAGIVEVCRDEGVAITARGGGTSTAGNAVGDGVVVDLRRHLRRIHEIDPEARTARVQPGVVLDDLQDAARPYGLRFGPEPSTHDRCTLGGMIGNNACGSRALGFGRTSDGVSSLSMVTGSGRRLVAGAGLDGAIGSQLSLLVDDHGEEIRSELGRFSRQISGYALQYLLAEHGAHLARALVGSEGTCGILTEATLQLVEVPSATLLVILGFPTMDAAADAAPALVTGFGATAIEGLDRRIVDVAAAQRAAQRATAPEFPRGDGWLIVELSGEDPDELVARVPRLVAAAGPLGHRVLSEAREVRAVWSIREQGAGLVARASTRPVYSGWEDAAVPAQRLGDYLRDFEDLLAEHRLDGVPYGHFGDGCVHVRIDFPFETGRTVFRDFLDDAARLVVSYGGSLSGEHGDGRARSALLPVMYSSRLLDAFGRFKAAFDPAGTLNPGVLVDPVPVDADLRPLRPRDTAGRPAFTLADDGGDLAAAVHRCAGIGKCAVGSVPEGVVMCPSYAATLDEQHSTRGRARVLQEAVTGGLPDGLSSAEVRDSLDWCMACKGCLSDCPTGVDMATYKAEVLHRTYRRRRRPWSHYTLGWLPRWLGLAARVPRAGSLATRSPIVGRGLKWLAGVDPQRSLPLISRRPQLDAIDATEGPDAVLWVDSFTAHLRPQVVHAAARVLAAAGYSVRTPATTACCALTWLSTGQLDSARRRLRRTVEALRAELDEGTVLVGLEPSCTAVLRRDALQLLGPDCRPAAEVAAATRTLAEALLARGDQWRSPRLDGRAIVAQPHCHHHAVMGWSADRQLLDRCGAEVTVVGGCCGLAGDFGTARGRYEISRRIAETALLPALRDAPGATVLADGYSCRTQVHDLDGRGALHLAELLAEALDEPDR